MNYTVIMAVCLMTMRVYESLGHFAACLKSENNSQEQWWEVDEGRVWEGIISEQTMSGSSFKSKLQWKCWSYFLQGMMNHPVISSLLKVVYLLNGSFSQDHDQCHDLMQSMLCIWSRWLYIYKLLLMKVFHWRWKRSTPFSQLSERKFPSSSKLSLNFLKGSLPMSSNPNLFSVDFHFQ